MKITNETRIDLKGKAKRIAGLWKKISSERPHLTFWAHARIISEKVGCQLRKLPESEWMKENDIHRLGSTNGKTLYVRGFKNAVHEAYVFFHEVGHVILHYGTERRHKILTTPQMEVEADDFATEVCMHLWPQHADLYKELSDNNAGKKDPFEQQLNKYFKN